MLRKCNVIGCGLSVILLLVTSLSVAADEGQSSISFSEYLSQLKHEASTLGIAESTLSSVFPQIKLFKLSAPPVVQEPESSVTENLETYLPDTVSVANVITARAVYKEHKAALDTLGRQYGVQPRFILALWGITSNFGAQVVSYPVLSVTASLAYQGEQTARYKEEFFAALKALEQEQIDYNDLRATREGGMGIMQMMPSQYLASAEDGNDDGNKDIWNSTLDAFASAASFLKQAGWKSEETWGRQVRTPEDLDLGLASLSVKKTFPEWSSLGLVRFDGSQLPVRADMSVSLIMPDGPSGRKYLVYDNYRALLAWTSSDYFAIAVTHLSERIKYPAINEYSN